MNIFGITAFADAAATTGAASQTTSSMASLLMLVVFIAIMYFLIIRPQKKREKEAKAMIEALKVGDKIVTIGGIKGKVTKIKDDTITIETGSTGNPAEKSYIKMEKDSVKAVEK